MDTPFSDHPPERPDLPPDVVQSLLTFSKSWAEWLEHDHMMAELHGHVIKPEQVAIVEGWKWMADVFAEWDE